MRLNARLVTYWLFTLPVTFENAAGFMWVFTGSQYLRTMLAHLGYPQYFQYILGCWQLACAATLLAPRLARAKEWAYAGAFFNYSSAVVSHIFAGDGPGSYAAAAFMGASTVVSWALRPSDRRLASAAPDRPVGASAWLLAGAVLLVMMCLGPFASPPPPSP